VSDPGALDGLGYRGATAVVVGCSTGIGQETLRILGELGAEVHALGRHEPPVPHASFVPVDLADLDSIAAAVESLASVAPIDHVLACAGVPTTRPPAEIVRVNYVGLRHLVDSMLPVVADGGAICVTASNTAYGWEKRMDALLELVRIPDPHAALAWCDEHPELTATGHGAYVFSKQALMTWVTDRAPTLGAERGIRLNCVAPGLTETPMVEEIASQQGSRRIIDAYPHPLLGRITTAEEGAWPIVLMNSRLNRSVTGGVLFADQGVGGGLATGALRFAP
jgi:NAD(P)-dependent dehydrogenase (short-subunit alcohol dehydrogenase family)